MPQPFLTPGVFVEEIPVRASSIQAAPTSITAFIGRAWRGPLDTPLPVHGMQQFMEVFGAPWDDAPMGDAVHQFFDNGGRQALVVRVATQRPDAATRCVSFSNAGRPCFLSASPGSWGLNLRLRVERAVADSTGRVRFDLEIHDDPALRQDQLQRGGSGMQERFRDLSTHPHDPRYATAVLARESRLLRAADDWDGSLPASGDWPAEPAAPEASSGSEDGAAIGCAELAGAAHEQAGTGLYALRRADLFNLLCVPPFTRTTADNGLQTWQAAARLCREQRAMLLIDAPADWRPHDASAAVATLQALDREHAVLYFPRLLAPDPERPGTEMAAAPCGAMAGVIARIDAERGVWQTPAGASAELRGGLRPALVLTDREQDALNPRAINAIRRFPGLGSVPWAGRTLIGDDREASQWKYLAVKRMALWIEQSLARSTRWTVFEPNEEPLWANLRAQTAAFMHGLFRQGAFQGSKVEHAYFVACDAQTTRAEERVQGRLNLHVGFAPLKPAEFVLVHLRLQTAPPH